MIKDYLRIIGPGLLVAIGIKGIFNYFKGYIDPGNWATDLEGGSRFGYSPLTIILISNLVAILLQSLSLRLGLVTNLDLAAACRLYFSRPMCWFLYIGAEFAIMAMDLAEIIGSAIALQLLFNLDLKWV
jgi:manganese transport protein